MQQWIKEWLDDGGTYAAAIALRQVAESRYNITPGSTIPVARRTSAGPTLELAKWAFPLDGRYIFNTRIETATTSPMWRTPIRSGRCVVPVTGFYEWKQKAPFFIHRGDGAPLLLAGVTGWREHRGEETFCTSIVTCPPDGLMAGLHDRMPAVLEPEAARAWADPGTGLEAALDLIVPDARSLTAHPVDRRVGDQGVDDPGLIRPIPTL